MTEELRKKLENFNQEHLLKFVDELGDAEKRLLINDIQNIDLKNVCQIFNEVSECGQNDQSSESVLEPLNDQVYQSIRDLNDEKRNYHRQIGEFDNQI